MGHPPLPLYMALLSPTTTLFNKGQLDQLLYTSSIQTAKLVLLSSCHETSVYADSCGSYSDVTLPLSQDLN